MVTGKCKALSCGEPLIVFVSIRIHEGMLEAHSGYIQDRKTQQHVQMMWTGSSRPSVQPRTATFNTKLHDPAN